MGRLCHKSGWSTHSEASTAVGSCRIQEKTWKTKDKLERNSEQGPSKNVINLLGRGWSISSRQTDLASTCGWPYALVMLDESSQVTAFAAIRIKVLDQELILLFLCFFFFLFLLERPLQKSSRLCRFVSDPDVWQNGSSRKYASTDNLARLWAKTNAPVLRQSVRSHVWSSYVCSYEAGDFILCFRHREISEFVADRTLYHNVIIMSSVTAKVSEQHVNRKCRPTRNTAVHLSTYHTDPEPLNSHPQNFTWKICELLIVIVVFLILICCRC